MPLLQDHDQDGLAGGVLVRISQAPGSLLPHAYSLASHILPLGAPAHPRHAALGTYAWGMSCDSGPPVGPLVALELLVAVGGATTLLCVLPAPCPGDSFKEAMPQAATKCVSSKDSWTME